MTMAELTDVHSIDEAVTSHIGEGRSFHTQADNLEFRATYNANRDLVTVYLPGRSTSRTMVPALERIRMWRAWLEKKSFTPGDYPEDLSRNRSYLLAMLKDLA